MNGHSSSPKRETLKSLMVFIDTLPKRYFIVEIGLTGLRQCRPDFKLISEEFKQYSRVIRKHGLR